ncbi:MAG TPA: hypothetical protein VFE52_10110 [Devosia sp.]|nr:hypothetical protein [Devosia sp.]
MSIGISEDIMDDWSMGADEESIIDDEASIGADDIIEESIIEDDASMGADDIMDESIIEEDMVESIIEDSIDDEASWAITGSARTAATAVVASSVRIIAGFLG